MSSARNGRPHPASGPHLYSSCETAYNTFHTNANIGWASSQACICHATPGSTEIAICQMTNGLNDCHNLDDNVRLLLESYTRSDALFMVEGGVVWG